MDPRIPVQIRPIIETYLARIDNRFSDLVSSCYVVGSIALNGFNPYFSDIDFVTCLQRQATMQDIALLGEIHQAIEAENRKLSGIYLQKEDVGKSESEIEPQPDRWRALVSEALSIRTAGGERFYRSRIKRAVDVRNFLMEVIRICNDLFE
jgi:hypothetical protein